jgi:hypothetical protein
MAIDYTKIDQDEVRDELITELQKTKSFKNANFSGSTLYDLANVLSYNASLFGFYLNQIANEPFLDTAKQYKNINRISNSLLYNPIGKGSAEVAVASALTKNYVLRNPEGFIEIPTFSQFPSTRRSSDGQNFAFTNEKPFVVQVQQFGVSFIKEVHIQYKGDVIDGSFLSPEQIIIKGQKKKPIQIVTDTGIDVIERDLVSIAHETLSTFVTNTVYSLILQKTETTYVLVIKPKTTVIEEKEILRFSVAPNRNLNIINNYSSGKIYVGRLGFRIY